MAPGYRAQVYDESVAFYSYPDGDYWVAASGPVADCSAPLAHASVV